MVNRIVNPKRAASILFILACVLFSLGDLKTNSRVLGTNDLAVYLVTNDVPIQSLLEGTILTNQVKIESDPIFSGRDFISFNVKSHTFSVTPDAARRFAERMIKPSVVIVEGKKVVNLWGAQDMPFLIVAEGEPIYIGVFSSPYSSLQYALPTIIPEFQFLPVNGKKKVGFKVEMDIPSDRDPRSDERLMDVSKKLR